MRQPRSAQRARPRAQRVLWFVLALLTLAPVFLCQAASSSEPAPPAAAAVTAQIATAQIATTQAATTRCDGAGHDAHCSRGAAVAIGASTRGARDGAPDLLLTLVAAAALFGVLRQLPLPPSGAPRRPVSGRQQLVTLGIARI